MVDRLEFHRSLSVLMDLPLVDVAPGFRGRSRLLMLLPDTVRVGIQQSTKKNKLYRHCRSLEISRGEHLRVLERRRGAIVDPVFRDRQTSKNREDLVFVPPFQRYLFVEPL